MPLPQASRLIPALAGRRRGRIVPTAAAGRLYTLRFSNPGEDKTSEAHDGTQLTSNVELGVEEPMLPLIEQHQHELEALCQRFFVVRLELFGSAVGGAFDSARRRSGFSRRIPPAGASRAGRRLFWPAALVGRFAGAKKSIWCRTRRPTTGSSATRSTRNARFCMPHEPRASCWRTFARRQSASASLPPE